MTTIRVSNIPLKSTIDDLIGFFKSRGIAVASGQAKISLTQSRIGVQTAVVTLVDEGAFTKAKALTESKRKLAGNVIDINADFYGFTTLSNGEYAE
jgi:hypothetical protein